MHYAIRLLKCLFCRKHIAYRVLPIQHTTVNFSKCNVPFRHNVWIKPLYNNNNQLAFLMGISHQVLPLPPLHINNNYNYDFLILELDDLPYGVVLTTCCSPYLVKFANKAWLVLCGYELKDILDKTFFVIQGTGEENKKMARQFKNKINTSLLSWKTIIMGLFNP